MRHSRKGGKKGAAAIGAAVRWKCQRSIGLASQAGHNVGSYYTTSIVAKLSVASPQEAQLSSTLGAAHCTTETQQDVDT